MNKFIKSFSDKRFRYGAFSTLTVALVIAALVAVNVVVSLFDLKYDLTVDKRYSISQESKDILAAVTDKVTIYALFKTGQENMQYKAIIDEYEESSSNISVVYKDPYLYPQFVESYKTDGADIPVDSIIVESDKRHKVILADDLYTLDYDTNTYSSYVSSIDIEPQVTNAIKYVSDDNTPIIYQVTNHSEAAITGNIEKQITLANYELRSLNIFDADAVPDDTSMIILSTPARDYTPDEAQKVRDYLEKGGRAFVFTDYMLEDQPNYSSIIEAYGIVMGKNLVLEGSRTNTYGNLPYYLLPNYANHDIVSSLSANNTYVMFGYSASINRLDTVKNSTLIEPILTTSNQSYAKSGDATSLNKENGDAEGPFDIAVAITDSEYQPETVIAKLVVVGTSAIADNGANSAVSGGNGDFILNSINWLNDRDDSVYIRSKTNNNMENLVMNDLHGLILTAASMFVLPGGIIIAGIVVALRRRNR